MSVSGEQQRGKVRYQRILDAALDVFSRRGYRDAAVDDIALASHTSKGGVYFHFPNKAAIFQALLRRTTALLMSRVETAMAGTDDPIGKVDAALATVLRLFAEHRTLARLFLVETLGAGPEFSAAIMQVHAEFARTIARHLDEAVRAGAIPPLDAEQAGIAWFGALNEVMTRWVLTGEPERLEEVYPPLRALLLRSVGAPLGGRITAGVPSAALPLDPGDLQALLLQGIRRAAERRAAVLVSISRPIGVADPLELFAQADALGYERVYWERCSDGVALAGAGAAHDLLDASPAAAGCAWRELLAGALIDDSSAGEMSGPLLIGGFSFDPYHTGTPLWAGFPPGRLTLPRLAVVTAGGSSVLTVNCLAAPDDDPAAASARLLRWIESLWPLRPRSTRWQGDRLETTDVPGDDDWRGLVAAAAHACGNTGEHALDKVVLARSVRATALAPFDAAAALARLRDLYPAAYVFAVARGVHGFLGATPERLVRLRDRTVEVACVAGSAPRGATPEHDAALGKALLACAKDRAEHEYVVQGVREALDGVCGELHAAGAPRLMRLNNLQHLYTPVEARATARTCVLDLVERLHPTPAVGGLPREPAVRYIAEHERLDRGWYAGPIGWVDRHGEGEFAVALRCALIHGAQATLFAGCGIVAGSQPDAELDETRLKLQPMLVALGARQE